MSSTFWTRYIFIVLTLSGVFSFLSAQAETPKVVISEVGATASGNGEWVEIVNTSDTPINITGWRFWEAGTNQSETNQSGTNHTLTIINTPDFTLPAQTYAVIVKNEAAFRTDHPTFTGILFGSSWSILTNSGEEIGLKTGTGDDTFIERFTYISASTPHSVERIDIQSTDTSSANWREHPTGDTAGLAFGSTITNPAPQPEPTPEPTPSPPAPTPTSFGNPNTLRLSEFLSDPNTGEHEWIEIENTSSDTIDLSQTVLRDGVGIIFSFEGTISGHSLYIATLPSARLNNSGDTISLETTDGTVIDRVTYGTWDDGNTADNIPVPEKSKTMSRVGSVWEETEPTPGTPNIAQATQTPAPAPVAPNPATQTLVIPSTVHAGDIIISEFVSDPTDGEVEFIELQNRSGVSIDLTGWRMEDGGNTKTTLSGVIKSMDFFVVEKPKGALNNAGDLIAVFDKENREIDKVSYGNWNDGNTSDNAPAPTDPMSAARKDGRDTGYDKDDFVVTPFITKGTTNRFSLSTEGAQRPVIIAGLIINELYPNPPGSDDDEFIELRHTGKTLMRLAGWKLRDESLRIFSLPDTVIYPNDILVFPKKQTGISLNNTTDAVELVDPNDYIADRVHYDHVPEGESYSRTPTGDWAWSTIPTEEKENIITEKNAAPVITVETESEGVVNEPHVFDASDTSDKEHDHLTFTWTFSDKHTQTGEQVTRVFTKAQKETILLEVKDSAKNTATTSVEVVIRATTENRTEHAEQSDSFFTSFATSGIGISELTPNPVGSDEAEYIELMNLTDQPKTIEAWTIADASGKTYTIPPTSFEAHGYVVLPRANTGIVLNNTTDSVTLKNSVGDTVDNVMYTGSKEGFAYAKNTHHEWAWTNTPTPGNANVFSSVASSIANGGAASQNRLGIGISTFATIRTFPKGKSVRVSGTVLAVPGTWSSQTMTIVEEKTGETLSLFLSNKQFPELKEGDVVVVQGMVSEVQGVKRVNAKKTSDIVHTGTSLLTPRDLGTALDAKKYLGHFVRLTGEVTSVSKQNFFLEAQGEMSVIYRGALLGTHDDVRIGDRVTVTGVITTQQDHAVLLPRKKEDIVRQNADNTQKELDSDAGPRPSTDAPAVATGASLVTLLAAAFGRARLFAMATGARRITLEVVSRFKPPNV